jgi:hypothetical protein
MIFRTLVPRFAVFLTALATPLKSAPSPEAMRSPVNAVFQFKQDGEFSGWPDGSTTKARSYLWIPENCKKLKGLLILCSNVPEQMLAAHPALRKASEANDLGIVWCPGSFFNFKRFGPEKKLANAESVAFLQQLLEGLAKTSGYPEVTTVPWIPIGESGHLLMSDALVESAPGRCIAGIWLKNNHLPPHDRTTPALVIFGSAQEWGQDKPDAKNHTDLRNRWSTNAREGYNAPLAERQAHPDWALTYFVDGGSGHFDCSEKIAVFVADYIDRVSRARLPLDGSTNLRGIEIAKGYLADMPLPGRENHPVTACTNAPAESKNWPWFFDKESAETAQRIAAINWDAQCQLPAVATTNGEVFPLSFNGIQWVTFNSKPNPYTNAATSKTAIPPILESEEDGITFRLKGVLLDKVPETFVGAGAGEQLATTPGEPTIEWMSGCVEPLGDNRMRIAPDRNWPSPIYLAVRQPGNATVKASVQPVQISRDFNTEGKDQKITFEPIPDVKAGTASIPLKASSDSGLPVRFFVDVGPAVVQGGNLVFTKIPPQAKLPITVTVGAWQFGRYAEPKVKRADVVKQSFRILP